MSFLQKSNYEKSDRSNFENLFDVEIGKEQKPYMQCKQSLIIPSSNSPMKTIEGTESSSMMTGAKQATIGLGIAAMALYAVKAKRSKNSQKEVSSGEEDQIANDINIV